MQLARAEGGRLKLDQESDLRDVLSVVVEDMQRAETPGRIVLSLPETPVLSPIDPDTVGILCRNLIENALQHGDEDLSVEVSLSAREPWSCERGAVGSAGKLERLTGRSNETAASAGEAASDLRSWPRSQIVSVAQTRTQVAAQRWRPRV